MSTKDALWESGYDETVEVNQRALIDKVLARYSGEFTVFRELLQNSDDAQSSAVEIRFDTSLLEGPASAQPSSSSAASNADSPHHAGTLAPSASSNNGLSSALETPDGELRDLKTITVQRWTFRNNGILFRDEDWSRLKKIAEGNPDEEKIGAFGVGFYSLFSITDDPFVTSGDQWMAFYWKDKKDQLYARRGALPEEKQSEWTSFEMPLREPVAIPEPFDFIRFLCSSITFMTSLRKVSVFLDDKCLACLEKTVGPPQPLGLPRGLNTKTPKGTMNVVAVRSAALHIRADVMKWVYSAGSQRKRPRPIADVVNIVKPSVQGFFSSIFSFGSSSSSSPSTPKLKHSALPPPPPEPEVNEQTRVEEANRKLLEVNSTSIALSVFTADVGVKLDRKMTAEMVRSTKKNPPSKMRFDLIYTGKEDYDASLEEDKKYPSSTGSIFQGLRADIEGLGTTRIFIGHATAQTTGIGGHMAARFIPTVERESIDFMDRNIAVWNKELLSVGGVLARTAYEFELAQIRADWDQHQTATSLPDEKIQDVLTGRAVHALKFFTFHTSTPSPEVSQLLEETFFASLAKFPIMSSRGVRSSLDVRLPDVTVAGFMKELPVLPASVTSASPLIVSTLQTRNLLKPTVFADILGELRSRPLNHEEMIACLKWWIDTVKGAQGWRNDPSKFIPFQRQLLAAAVLMLSKDSSFGVGEDNIIPLADVKTFVSPKTILLTDGPLPAHILPLCVSKEFTPDALLSALPWTELAVDVWLAHLCSLTGKAGQESYDITLTPGWAERVLAVLARAWPSLPAATKQTIYNLLVDKTCIPTNVGMKLPADAYFPNVNMFPDLPIVTLPSGNAVRGGLEKFLQAIGVRKHVELQVIFTRMIKTNQWTIAELIKYLVSVRNTLTKEEMEYLRNTNAFSKELDRAPDAEGRAPRYSASQLYEPTATFRALKLPVLDWGTKVRWRSNSDEAKFLQEIGLQMWPKLPTLIMLCASDDVGVRDTALRYLIENIPTKYTDYDAETFAHAAYLPAIKDGSVIVGTPREVFADSAWGSLGFAVLHRRFESDAGKLQVKPHPSSRQLVALLEEKPPKTEGDASRMFTILASRIADFSPAQLNHLSKLPIVPSGTGKDGTVRMLPPSQCFLRANTGAIHSKLFTFVKFEGAANGFLTACGAKLEPSLDEIAKILLADPRKFYELCEGPEQYLVEMRNLAVNIRSIPDGTLSRMKRNPILLATQRKSKSSAKEKEKEMDDDEWDISYDLKTADQIVVVDDTAAYQVFGDLLYTAPQEDILEGLYLVLGSRKLSGLVKEEHHASVELPSNKRSEEIRSLVLERLPLFLYEHTHSKTKVSLTWLSSPNNFKVRSFGTLAISKTLHFGSLRKTQRNDASAVAKRAGVGGPIELWIAGNTQVDMYEVALSMNRLMFDNPKTNDALLLMTILSTDLRSLKRRGYNVNRILKQQQHAREAQLPPPPPPNKPSEKQGLAAIDAPPQLPPKPDVRTSGGSGSDKGFPGGLPTPQGPPPAVQNTLQSLRQRFETSVLNRPPSTPRTPEPPLPPTYSSSPSPGPQANPTLASQGAISSNIEQAIKACRPESHNLLRNREHMQQVKESLNESYCDVSGMKEHLASLGQIGNVKIYISQSVPPSVSKTFIADKREGLTRFIYILQRLARVYGLPENSLHIFYDMHGGIIGFNRDSTIFMNFRYYESWHDAQVGSGQTQEAYISWYFTLAHEIAHNLVQPHNAEHEFYFSAICEKHLMGLTALLSSR